MVVGERVDRPALLDGEFSHLAGLAPALPGAG